jgi:N,N-dimethylformamidase beta subunit-like, C-terminal
MATSRHHLNPSGAARAARLATILLFLATLAAVCAGAGTGPGWPVSVEEEEEGRDTVALLRTNDPFAIEAAFPRESYGPGSTALLRSWTTHPGIVTIRILHVGPERMRTVGDMAMHGVQMGLRRRVGSLRDGQNIPVRIGEWPSGLYAAELTASGGRIGYAPFVVRPGRLGEHRVAVILPTHTWQAYNFHDDDRDGTSDTWYANQHRLHARLGRPYLNCGVPPHFRQYDLKFLRWLSQTGRSADILSQTELDETDGKTLAAAYDLIVFPGHHEYVTTGEYDAIRGFRDLGGNLAFLSANNFFWRIHLERGVMTKVAQWRDLGLPEAALLGVQYIGNDQGGHRGPWLVRTASDDRWLFDGVKLTRGHEFSNAGIEIDATTPSSPPGTLVVAEIADLLGPGMTAQMSYYETPAGAKVFAAGAFTLAGSLRQPAVRRLVANLWAHLTAA